MSGPSGPFGTTFGIRYKTVLSWLKSSVVESQAQEFSSSLRLRGWRPRRGRTLTIIGLPWSNICLSESSCTQCTEPTASSTVELAVGSVHGVELHSDRQIFDHGRPRSGDVRGAGALANLALSCSGQMATNRLHHAPIAALPAPYDTL